MSDERPITSDEMVELFGERMPIEAVMLLWGSPDEMTIGQLRAKLRQIARERKPTR